MTWAAKKNWTLKIFICQKKGILYSLKNITWKGVTVVKADVNIVLTGSIKKQDEMIYLPKNKSNEHSPIDNWWTKPTYSLIEQIILRNPDINESN